MKTAKRKLSVLFTLILLSFVTVFAVSNKTSSYTVQRVVLTVDNTATLMTDVNDRSVNYAIETLDTLDKTKPRYLLIESPGGEVVAGLNLVEYLRSDAGKGVICIANKAASMAFVTLQSCETRLVTETTLLMSHGVSAGLQGDTHSIEQQLKFMEQLENMLFDIIATRLGITVEELKKHQRPEWWFAGAKEALKYNAADGVVSYVIVKPKK